MIRLIPRRTGDLAYLENDAARELEGVRDGPALWWPHGEPLGDPSEVLSRRSRGTLVGYDVIVAAPRPVSIVLAIGSLEDQRAVVRAHRTAVSEVVGYLEREALVVRRSVLGEVDELRATWSGVAAFTHGVNRAGEPHLHDHVLVGSRPREFDRAIDGRSLHVHALDADALYRSSLRYTIGRESSRTAWRSFSGVEYVSGVDEAHRALWPGRANDRTDKVAWSRRAIVERWRHDASMHEPGWSAPIPKRERGHVDEHSFSAHFEGLHRVARHDVVTAWANAAVFGAPTLDVEAAINHWYPEFRSDGDRGSRVISRERARLTRAVREHGARPLESERFDHWTSRSRSRERTSREWER